MEIDSNGWMWIVDVGRLNIFGTDPTQIINGIAIAQDCYPPNFEQFTRCTKSCYL